jgi:autotransporter-associated beta strand protein
VGSVDPNNIQGPSGFGAQGFVQPELFSYAIEFENQPSATAPAQSVVVTQQLDSNLDWSTFQLGSFGFGNTIVNVPSGRTSYSTQLDLTASLGVLVDVTASFNPLTGLATWTFTSLDPTTLDVPADPLAGFLPPDNNSGIGEGFVNYSVSPKANSTTGTQVKGQATVVFDMNPPLATAPILNTIDSGAPTSTVAPLPATEGAASFPVSWSGQDDANGSGIASYNVYVSDNGGAFTLWQSATTHTSATYAGQNGHTYGFYSVATDNVGNQQALPTTAQATTFVAVSGQVTNNSDNGPGSLRQALLDAAASTGAPHTIVFAIPAGSQTITPLSPLPSVNDPLTLSLDATQNVSIVTSSSAGWDNHSTVIKTGSGTLNLTESSGFGGAVQVHGGLLRLTGVGTPAFPAGTIAVVDQTGTLELAGSASALTGGSVGVNVTNNSTAATGLLVSGSTQIVGGIDGTGNLVINAGASLTANHINEGALVIGGTAGSPGVVTIAASDANGDPPVGSTGLTATIAAVSPNPRNTPVGSINITFSEPVFGFSLANLTLTENGGPNLLSAAQTLTTSDNIHWTLSNLTNLTTSTGRYSLGLSPSGIHDAAGNLSTAASANFTVDTFPPTVFIAAVPNPRTTPVDQIAITFSKPVFGFTLGNLQLTDNGGPDLIAGSGATLTSSDNVHWSLGNLTSLTTTVGSYTLTLSPTGIHDAATNALAAGASTSFVVQAAAMASGAAVAGGNGASAGFEPSMTLHARAGVTVGQVADAAGQPGPNSSASPATTPSATDSLQPSEADGKSAGTSLFTAEDIGWWIAAESPDRRVVADSVLQGFGALDRYDEVISQLLQTATEARTQEINSSVGLSSTLAGSRSGISSSSQPLGKLEAAFALNLFDGNADKWPTSTGADQLTVTDDASAGNPSDELFELLSAEASGSGFLGSASTTKR